MRVYVAAEWSKNEPALIQDWFDLRRVDDG